MSHGLNGLYKTAGFRSLSAVFYSLLYLLGLMAGLPPSKGAEILAWRATGELPQHLLMSLIFCRSVFSPCGNRPLIYSSEYRKNHRGNMLRIIAVVISIVIVVLPMIHVRLFYPVYGIQVNTPAIAELVIAVYYGGQHAIGLLLGFATIVLSKAMKHGVYGENIAYLGIATGIFDIIVQILG